MVNGNDVQAQSSQLSSARTLCREEADEHDDFPSVSPLMRPEIVRKSVDDSETSPGGIEAIYQVGKTLGQYVSDTSITCTIMLCWLISSNC